MSAASRFDPPRGGQRAPPGEVWTAFSPGSVGSDTIIYHRGPGFFAIIAAIYGAGAQRATFHFKYRSS